MNRTITFIWILAIALFCTQMTAPALGEESAEDKEKRAKKWIEYAYAFEIVDVKITDTTSQEWFYTVIKFKKPQPITIDGFYKVVTPTLKLARKPAPPKPDKAKRNDDTIITAIKKIVSVELDNCLPLNNDYYDAFLSGTEKDGDYRMCRGNNDEMRGLICFFSMDVRRDCLETPKEACMEKGGSLGLMFEEINVEFKTKVAETGTDCVPPDDLLCNIKKQLITKKVFPDQTPERKFKIKKAETENVKQDENENSDDKGAIGNTYGYEAELGITRDSKTNKFSRWQDAVFGMFINKNKIHNDEIEKIIKVNTKGLEQGAIDGLIDEIFDGLSKKADKKLTKEDAENLPEEIIGGLSGKTVKNVPKDIIRKVAVIIIEDLLGNGLSITSASSMKSKRVTIKGNLTGYTIKSLPVCNPGDSADCDRLLDAISHANRNTLNNIANAGCLLPKRKELNTRFASTGAVSFNNRLSFEELEASLEHYITDYKYDYDEFMELKPIRVSKKYGYSIGVAITPDSDNMDFNFGFDYTHYFKTGILEKLDEENALPSYGFSVGYVYPKKRAAGVVPRKQLNASFSLDWTLTHSDLLRLAFHSQGSYMKGWNPADPSDKWNYIQSVTISIPRFEGEGVKPYIKWSMDENGLSAENSKNFSTGLDFTDFAKKALGLSEE